ncbi:glycosyltransferase family 1 protein [Trichlorobacter ammonificans]|uniref:Glycogen phosphorylase n=1 Tax=Trichlorobacter ammonificans TaxID=2916410 RepID=A0ABM9DBP0_9BACT|nr:glycosyltransferase family 1 protein [Trichlorobacter ammonificans]CAH2032661.1 Glycogen phosphorylase [Trichlorobacter ammonificans]
MDFSKYLHKFTVVPSLSDELAPLQRIAYNLWWSWEPDAISLFRRLDQDLWSSTRHNPVEMLGILQQTTLESLKQDEGFMAHLQMVDEKLTNYLGEKSWFQREYNGDTNLKIAYFSMEFGLHESLPVYSGGLGILAGDHLKSASDLGLPLVGVGLLYRQGYFRQYLNNEGWQQEIYPENDFYNLPLTLERDSAGMPLEIELEFGPRHFKVHIWRVQVGRVPLYLLDTNLEENAPEDRLITAQLYGGNQEMRMLQEILLGIGGVRALRALRIIPNVCHMNEGHAAFLALERIRLVMEKRNISFREALEVTRAGNVFTTHTPVEAGIDHFPTEMLDKYFSKYIRSFGLSRDEFLGLGRQRPGDQYESFCMAVLALKLAGHANGVSQLHGEVSRSMWKNLWPELPEEQLPLTSITNGVHTRTWMSGQMGSLLVRYLGTRWLDDPTDHNVWRRISRIPDAELWRTRQTTRERLVDFARCRLKLQLKQIGATAKEIATADEVLDPEVLTIGFARRFATYKRGTLLLRDLERLHRILNNAERPVQIIFAGKAHPHDTEGKELIRQIVQVSHQERFRHRIVFIEDYDMEVARHLVQGVDVWLNTPRRPMEASGTSGMKVAFNAGLNLSVLDGWWCEGYQGNNGWAIGKGEVYADMEYQNQVESGALYDLLEKEVVPLFYQRGGDGIPRDWVGMMKASMQSLCPVFSTDRMVQEYAQFSYVPSYRQWAQLEADDLALARELSGWKQRLFGLWPGVTIEGVDAPLGDSVAVGSNLPVSVRVGLGDIQPDDVLVEGYFGVLDNQGTIRGGETVSLAAAEVLGGGLYRFAGELECRFCGRYAFMVRVMPRHPRLGPVYEPGYMIWG